MKLKLSDSLPTKGLGVPLYLKEYYVSFSDDLIANYGDKNARKIQEFMGLDEKEVDNGFENVIELYKSGIIAVHCYTVSAYSIDSIVFKDWVGPILIHGESGTGKELLVNHLFDKSNKSKRKINKTDSKLFKINCSAIPEHLAESVLFGHKKGAFTGATNDKMGLLEQANGGTVFLDEISRLGLSVQEKLLRVLATGDYSRVGEESKKREADIQIIAATNEDLWSLIENHRFLGDLFFRLSGLHIKLPNLAERYDADKKALVTYFLLKEMEELNCSEVEMSDKLFKMIWQAPYSGNIREMEFSCKRFVHEYKYMRSYNEIFLQVMFHKYLSPGTKKALESKNDNKINETTNIIDGVSNVAVSENIRAYIELLKKPLDKKTTRVVLSRFKKDWLKYHSIQNAGIKQKVWAEKMGMDSAKISHLKRNLASIPGLIIY